MPPASRLSLPTGYGEAGKALRMSENQTTMAPQAICQDVAEKGYEGLVLTRH